MLEQEQILHQINRLITVDQCLRWFCPLSRAEAVYDPPVLTHMHTCKPIKAHTAPSHTPVPPVNRKSHGLKQELWQEELSCHSNKV